ncbi:MAG: DUF2339 domain-containing protein, partial [Candidatus Obscuribacterales bacterium]|nr:DUF2339 domain-containing protein [Candidatus Obscuribacterales bacterium]
YSIAALSSLLFLLFSFDARKASADLWLSLAYILPYWSSATLLPLSLGEGNPKARRAALSMTVLCSFVSSIELLSSLAANNLNANQILFFSGALLYAAVSYLQKRLNCPAASFVNALLSLSSSALLIPEILHGPSRLLAFTFQLAILLWSGLQYRLRSFLIFSYPLSLALLISCFLELAQKRGLLFLGPLNIPYSVLNVLPSLLVLTLGTAVFQIERFKNSISAFQKEFSFHWFLHLSGVLMAVLVPVFASSQNSAYISSGPFLLCLGWSMEAFAMGLLALSWRRNYLIALSCFGFFMASIASMFVDNLPLQVSEFLSIASVYVLSFKFRACRETRENADKIFILYYLLASLWLFGLETKVITDLNLYASVLAAQALLLVFLGAKSKELLLRATGVFAALILLCFLWTETRLSGYSSIVSVFAVFLVGELYRKMKLADLHENLRVFLRNLLNVLSVIVLSKLLGEHFYSYYVSLGFALEGSLLLAAGFTLKDKILRITGLSVFGLLVLRLIFVDLAAAATIYRIFAFIIAGLVLMLAAYAYAYFSKKDGEFRENPN